MRGWFLISLVVVLTSTGCSLRPRYREVVQASAVAQQGPDGEVTVRIVEAGTRTPIKGARVSIANTRPPIRALSDERGELVLPVTTELTKSNPLIVVDLPGGVRGYEFVTVHGASPVSPADGHPNGRPSSEALSPPDGASAEEAVAPPGMGGLASPGVEVPQPPGTPSSGTAVDGGAANEVSGEAEADVTNGAPGDAGTPAAPRD